MSTPHPMNDFVYPLQLPMLLRPPSNVPYLIAAVVMVLAGATGTILITLLLPTRDNTILIGILWGPLVSTTVGVLGFMKAQETHTSVNGQLHAFMQAARAAALAEGREAGRLAALQEISKQEVPPATP